MLGMEEQDLAMVHIGVEEAEVSLWVVVVVDSDLVGVVGGAGAGGDHNQQKRLVFDVDRCPAQ